MAQAGDTIENPPSGERITFDVTGEESGGEYLKARILLAPFGVGPPEHVHPVIEERFRIVSGRLSARVAGSRGTYGPGEELVVPPGTAHRWWNDTDETVEIEAVVRPALPLDRFLENVFALSHLGLTNRHGLPGPLRMSRILPRYRDVVHLARPPRIVQRIVMGILGVVARMLGYPEEYPYPYPRVASEAGEGAAGTGGAAPGAEDEAAGDGDEEAGDGTRRPRRLRSAGGRPASGERPA